MLDHQLERVASLIADAGRTPLGDAYLKALKEREYGHLVKSIDPSTYDTSFSYWKDNLLTSLLRKLDGLPLGRDLEREAIEKFLSLERSNAATNRRMRDLRQLLLCPTAILEDDERRLVEFINSVRKEIDALLGPLPRDLQGRFGKGATFHDKRHVSIPDKMSSRPTVTSDARCFIQLWESTWWARALCQDFPDRSEPQTVRGNRFATVNKDSTKKRGICIEPGLNVFYQLPVGRLLKALLKDRWKIDLKLGQQYHRSAAMQGSRDQTVATIDLSDASDLISHEVVKLLLPRKWFELLNSLRSPYTQVEGKWYKLEKFSSMGNGFTFELETIIFAAIARSTAKARGFNPLDLTKQGRLLQYGDDCICPSEIFGDVTSAFKFFGFVINEKKSYSMGPFRESCGGDFYLGDPVRGHYVEAPPATPKEWMGLANGLRRSCFDAYGLCPERWMIVRDAWEYCVSRIPKTCRLYGPTTLGDCVIHSEYTEKWTTKTRNWCRSIKTLQPRPVRIDIDKWAPSVALASALYGSGSSISPRGEIEGYYQQWTALPL